MWQTGLFDFILNRIGGISGREIRSPNGKKGSEWTDCMLRVNSDDTPLVEEETQAETPRALDPVAFDGGEIIRWADAHFERTGKWPRQTMGEVEDVPGITWRGVDRALRRGLRGLPGGDSLARLLARHRQVQPRCSRAPAGEGHPGLG